MPATFCGGPRYMFERQQVAMAYVRKFWPTRFIQNSDTNPKWPEILESLTPGQQPRDSPNLLVSFSSGNQNLLMILKDDCFGCLEAWLYSIEFQKRGLSYAHTRLWQSHDAKFYFCNYFYHFICVHYPKTQALSL